MAGIYDFTAETLDGQTAALDKYRGRVLLIVNTASKCGFTPQYEGLEELHRTYGPKGFEVLGFPCDQFLHQEPGDSEEIARFCKKTYDVTFPMFAKIEVNGAKAHPLWAWLKAEKSGFLSGAIKWNFTKFLVGKDGRVIERYPPTTTPAALAPHIEAALASA
jgi:glutathione peroxidase